jgi:hypothetical protein
MSAIEKAAAMLRREAESMKECHTVGVGGAWYGESAKAEYDEMIAVAAAAIAERDELLEALQEMVAGDAEAIEDAKRLGVPFPDEMLAAYHKARAAIARATGESE